MEPKILHYPVYIPDQFLTSQNLNDSTAYLEQQERISRIAGCGNGVIKGLGQVTASAASITIEAGCGFTPDGYYLETPSLDFYAGSTSVTYSYATTGNTFQLITIGTRKLIVDTAQNLSEFKDSNGNFLAGVVVSAINDVIELSTDAPSATNTTSISFASAMQGKNINNYTLVLLADTRDIQYSNCSAGDCNDKGTDRRLAARMLLVPYANFAPINSSRTPWPLLKIPRPGKISAMNSVATFYTMLQTAFDASINAIIGYFNARVPNSSSQVSRLTDIKSGFDAAISTNNKVFLQYYLSFVHDMQQAINEYATGFNDYNTSWPVIGTGRIERTIVLKKLSDSLPLDQYRYYWAPAVSPAEMNIQQNTMGRMFQRLLTMPASFVKFADLNSRIAATVGGSNAGTVKLIPSREAHVRLADKAIPFYYDTFNSASTLKSYWRSEHNLSLELTCCYHDNVSQTDMLNSNVLYTNNFFRIEGHHGMNKTSAFNAVSSLVSSADLPIQVLLLDIMNTEWQTYTTGYQATIATFNTVISRVQAMLKEKKIKVPALDYLKNDMNAVSPRDLDQVQYIMGNSLSYFGTIHAQAGGGTKKMMAKKIETGGDQIVKQDIPYQDMSDLIKQSGIENILLTQMKEVAKKKPRIPIRAGGTHTTTVEILSINDVPGLEYLGGVYRGGTFVLLHDGTNIIGDATVPYIVQINKIRLTT